MKYLILSAIVLSLSCTKVNTWWQSDAAGKLFPPKSQIDISYPTVGAVQLSGVTAWWSVDTLNISAQGQAGALKLWVKATTLKDTTYNLDGYSGNLYLYDNMGNIAGFSGGNCTISFYQVGNAVVNGLIYGSLNNVTATSSVATVSGEFYNVSVAGKRF